jgi:2-dehydro-3-deoxygluconokinase
MPYIRVLIGNEEDFTKALGLAVEGVGEGFRNLEVERYKQMAAGLAKKYPHVEVVGTTLREVVSGLVNHWSAILYFEGKFYGSRKYENLEIEDRVGGGDGFASGMIYALLSGKPAQEAVEWGAAHGALAQSTRGDTSMVTVEEIAHVVKGGGARIKR